MVGNVDSSWWKEMKKKCSEQGSADTKPPKVLGTNEAICRCVWNPKPRQEQALQILLSVDSRQQATCSDKVPSSYIPYRMPRSLIPSSVPFLQPLLLSPVTVLSTFATTVPLLANVELEYATVGGKGRGFVWGGRSMCG